MTAKKAAESDETTGEVVADGQVDVGPETGAQGGSEGDGAGLEADGKGQAKSAPAKAKDVNVVLVVTSPLGRRGQKMTVGRTPAVERAFARGLIREV